MVNITLTPGELYYLGTIMQAKYIDYAYVAAMEDIRKNYAVFETQTRTSLTQAGVLTEDFSGELTLDEDVKALLTPIFFGEFESCVDITALGDRPAVNTSRFHVLDTAATMVRSTPEGKLLIEQATAEKLTQMAETILPADYACTETAPAEDFQPEAITRIIAVKNTWVGKTAQIRLFVEANGVIYAEDETGAAIRLDARTFTDAVLSVIKEAK